MQPLWKTVWFISTNEDVNTLDTAIPLLLLQIELYSEISSFLHLVMRLSIDLFDSMHQHVFTSTPGHTHRQAFVAVA